MALDRLPANQPDRALVLATLCSELALGSPLERRQSLADEALAIAESSGDDASTVRVLSAVSYSLLVPSLLEQALTLSADALVRAERVGDPTLHFLAYLIRIDVAAQSGDIDEVDRGLLALGSLAEQLDQPFFSWTHAWLRSTRAQIAGDWNRAEQLATEALQIGTDGGQPDTSFMFGSQLIIVNHQRGTLGELVPVLEQMVADAPDLAGVLTAALALAYTEARQNRRGESAARRFRCWRIRSSPRSGLARHNG